jgi:hypothetical protein
MRSEYREGSRKLKELEYFLEYLCHSENILCCFVPNPKGFYQVQFVTDEDRVRFVYSSHNSDSIQGIDNNSSNLKWVLEKFGEPSNISTNQAGTERIYSFDEYQVFSHLSKDKVRALGIYNPMFGPSIISDLPTWQLVEEEVNPLGLFPPGTTLETAE